MSSEGCVPRPPSPCRSLLPALPEPRPSRSRSREWNWEENVGGPLTSHRPKGPNPETRDLQLLGDGGFEVP